MAGNSVQVSADLPSGFFLIALTQTGPASASLDEKVWPAGSGGKGQITSDTTYALANISVSDGDFVTCTTTAMVFFHPTITFQLSAPGEPSSVTVASPKGTDVYPLSESDRDAFGKFLAAANFPVGDA